MRNQRVRVAPQARHAALTSRSLTPERTTAACSLAESGASQLGQRTRATFGSTNDAELTSSGCDGDPPASSRSSFSRSRARERFSVRPRLLRFIGFLATSIAQVHNSSASASSSSPERRLDHEIADVIAAGGKAA